MKRVRCSVVLLSLGVLAGCGPVVDMAIIAVMESDNKRVQRMPSEQAMAYKPVKLAVVRSNSNYEPALQQAIADALRSTANGLPGVEVVNTAGEADSVLRPELSNATTSVRKTGQETAPKWQLTGRVQGTIRFVDKAGEEKTITLSTSKNKSFGTPEASGSSTQKANLLKDAARSAVRSKKTALKRAFPMPMYILESKGARKYVKLNRGRIHKVQKGQKLEMLDSKTGQSVAGTIKVFEINEETCWAETDSSARIGALVGLKCVPVGR